MPAEVALGRVHRHAAGPQQHDEHGVCRRETRVGTEGEAEAEAVDGIPGDGEARDDSVDGARRHRHTLALVVFGKPGSTRTALDAAERIAALLDEAALALDGHALVTLRVESVAARRDERSGETRATVTLKAVTEVLAG